MIMDLQHLLAIREAIKNKKPDFIRQDAHKKKKLAVKWKKPRGIDSKIRLHKRGYRRAPSQGYRSPRDAKGLLPDGRKAVVVHAVKDLATINKSTDAIIIGTSVGMKKRVAILTAAIQQGLLVANIRNAQQYLSDAEAKVKQRKAAHEEKKLEKEKKTKDKEKKAKEQKEKHEKKEHKETIETAISEEEKKEQEKKELDKLLTQKS